MKELLFATSNKSKVDRYKEKLLEKGIEMVSLKDIDLDIEVEENGKDAIENALIKARAYYNATKMPTMGNDTNLYLENVPDDKQPGVFVRRVGGRTLTDEEMIEHYTNLVKEYGENGRLDCKWVYGLAVINENGKENTYTWYKDNFYMVDKSSDKITEGYPLNSISKYKGSDKYFTDMNKEDMQETLFKEDDVIDFIVKNIY